jgi:hypothetical protein
MEYSHEQAVADSVNVGFEGLSHPHSDQRTWICFNVDNRDKLMRKGAVATTGRGLVVFNFNWKFSCSKEPRVIISHSKMQEVFAGS